jgi:hypothetical protein
LVVLVNRRLYNSLEYALYKNPIHTDRYLQAAPYNPAVHKSPVITALTGIARTDCDEPNSAPGLHVKSMATPSLTSTEQPKPNPPTKATEDTAHVPHIRALLNASQASEEEKHLYNPEVI